MFLSSKKKTIVGLDIGTGSVKAVQLELNDNTIVFQDYKILNLTDQGILNDSEYCHTISVWLEENHWKNIGICTALPQYLTTVNVRDFPGSAKSEHLMESMINYETQHLSGISEENFINDYHSMPSAFGRTNPVLIGICKESVIQEKVEILENIGLNLIELSIDSIAAVNALFSLHPNLKKEPKPQLILEIGNDSTTGIITAQGQILYISSLIAGVGSIRKELLDSGKNKEPDPEQEHLQVIRPVDKTKTPRVGDTLRQELQNLVEQWSNLENQEMQHATITHIWLSGGGAKLEGLSDYLYADYKCPIEIFGPRDPQNGKIMPELGVAYGLAIMGLEQEEISISLCPDDIQWSNQRKKNFNFLVAASLLLVFSIIVYLLGQYINLSVVDHRNRSAISRLSKCNTLIPQLENTLETIAHHQKMMIPFVVKGNSSNRFIAAFKEIAKATSNDHFFIYIADDETFREGKLAGGAAPAKAGLNSSFFKSIPGKTGPSIIEDPAKFKIVDKMEEINAIVLIGYTLCETNNEHFEDLRKIQAKLNESALFAKIDILSEEELNGRKDIFDDWDKNVINNRNLKPVLKRKRFRAFGIRIPFAEKNIKLAELKK